MVERVRELALAGQWAQVIELATSMMPTAAGDELARLHLYLSAAYASSATCSDHWRKALASARVAHRVAAPGSIWQVWALQKLSSLLVDMGRPGEAKVYAHAYLKASPVHPALSGFTPFVFRDLGRAAYQNRRFLAAASYHRKANQSFESAGKPDEATRSALNIVWALARANKPHLARTFLPTSVPDHMDNLRRGAKAIILYAEGRWAEAREAGLVALQGSRLAHDYVDAAEVALIVAESSRRLGDNAEAFAFSYKAAHFAARQSWTASALLVLHSRAGGGDSPDATTSRGAGGYHPSACFTTGVA